MPSAEEPELILPQPNVSSREPGASGTPLPGLARRRAVDRLASWGIKAVAFSAIAAVALIFVFVVREAIPVFDSAEVREEVTPASMVLPQTWGKAEAPSFRWQPASKVPKYSLAPLVVGTFKVTIVALLFAVPLAILAAVFSAEFAPRRLREVVKPAIELLAGIPSVVLGFFALMVLATFFQQTFGFHYRLNAIVAGVGLGLTIIPVVYTVSEDALIAVPRVYREASLALGASRARTAWSVILPAASPGIFAAVVLGFGRAMGETMIVLMASGNAAILSVDPSDSVRTIPATIAAEMGEVVVGGAHWSVLFLLGSFLFLVTLTFNGLGGWYVARLRRKLGGLTA
ncbi:phosphate ABC transporter permease subunit PstC [Vulgatibacter incomptus]|nr:phosphate ABC transporter permease subunit PstC [Vulgatibacter incomptus]